MTPNMVPKLSLAATITLPEERLSMSGQVLFFGIPNCGGFEGRLLSSKESTFETSLCSLEASHTGILARMPRFLKGANDRLGVSLNCSRPRAAPQGWRRRI